MPRYCEYHSSRNVRVDCGLCAFVRGDDQFIIGPGHDIYRTMLDMLAQLPPPTESTPASQRPFLRSDGSIVVPLAPMRELERRILNTAAN